MRLTRSDQPARELVQDTFLHAIENATQGMIVDPELHPEWGAIRMDEVIQPSGSVISLAAHLAEIECDESLSFSFLIPAQNRIITLY